MFYLTCTYQHLGFPSLSRFRISPRTFPLSYPCPSLVVNLISEPRYCYPFSVLPNISGPRHCYLLSISRSFPTYNTFPKFSSRFVCTASHSDVNTSPATNLFQLSSFLHPLQTTSQILIDVIYNDTLTFKVSLLALHGAGIKGINFLHITFLSCRDAGYNYQSHIHP